MTETAKVLGPRRVAVLMGGQSDEREVSLRSGATVALRLASDRYQVKPVLIRADGRWEIPQGLVGNGLPARAEDWFPGVPLLVEEALRRLRDDTDVVFIALHGPMGEDGTVQGLLQMVGLPFTGPEVTAAAVAMDKLLTKEILIARSIPTPRYFAVASDAPRRRTVPEGESSRETGIDWEAVLREGLRKFPLPWVLKPNRLGSSVGVVIARSEPEFLSLAAGAERYLPWASGGPREQGGEILVEEFIEGRELTCGVISSGGSGPRALPPVEIRPVTSKFFDYQAKYTPGASEEICPAPIPPAVTREVQDLAIAVHRAVRADPLSRTDFILDPRGKLHVLEINTIPGMTATSLIPLSAGKAGIDLGDLLRDLVEHALRRAGRS